MADKASKAGEQTGGGGTGIEAPSGAPAVAGQDESVAIGSAGADPVAPDDQDDEPVDPKVMTTSRFAKKHPTLHDPNLAKPNSPAFDYDRKSGKPRLADGETVIAEATKHGVQIAVTNHGRKIFCCTLDKYEAAFGQLPNRKLYERFFPDAK
jgi:hypothetical protein